jgi:hypothetical protein
MLISDDTDISTWCGTRHLFKSFTLDITLAMRRPA